jgi:hypothetical protein
LEYPEPSRYTIELAEFKKLVKNELEKFIEDDETVQLWLQDEEELSGGARFLVSELQKVRHLDSRFNYFRFLVNLHRETEEMLKLLSGEQSDTDKLVKAGCYSNKYRYRKDDLAKDIVKEKQRVPKLVTGIGIVFATVVTVVVSKLGEEILETLQTYLGT